MLCSVPLGSEVYVTLRTDKSLAENLVSKVAGIVCSSPSAKMLSSAKMSSKNMKFRTKREFISAVIVLQFQ